MTFTPHETPGSAESNQMAGLLGTLPARAAFHAQSRPLHPAVICEGRTLTYSELHRGSNQTAHALRREGAQVGTRVAYLGRESEYYYDIALACAKIGAVLVPVNWKLTIPEVQYILADSSAEIIFIERAFTRLLDRDLATGPAIGQKVITLDTEDDFCEGLLTWRSSAPDDDVALQPGPDVAVAQIYTSGTTGLPKGVILAHRTFLTLSKHLEQAGCDWFDWGPTDRGLSCFPGLHTSGFGWFMHSLNAGATTIIMRSFVADHAARLAQEHAATLMWAAPSMLHMMMAESSVTKTMFASIRKIVYSGSPIDRDLLRRCLDFFDCALAQGYSSAEAGSFVTCLAPSDHTVGSTVLASAGRACPGSEIAILDDAGERLPSGQPGRVAVKSPARFVGYWNLPEASADVIQGDWLMMGDRGYLDSDGYLFLMDRVNDTIISAGQNIYPAEVEAALKTHPQVEDVAVFGVDDARWGQVARAAVVVQEGTTLTPRELIKHLNGTIANFKIPVGYDLVRSLPRNPTGKLLRRVLVQQHAASLQNAQTPIPPP